MNTYSFENLKIGQTESYCTTITENMLDSFRRITGDINPLHFDHDFAVSHGFKDIVCFGMLTASLLSTLVGVYLPGKRSLIQKVEASFSKPVYVGDRLEISGKVHELNESVLQIVLKVEIRNQNDEKVLKGKMEVGVLDE